MHTGAAPIVVVAAAAASTSGRARRGVAPLVTRAGPRGARNIGEHVEDVKLGPLPEWLVVHVGLQGSVVVLPALAGGSSLLGIGVGIGLQAAGIGL